MRINGHFTANVRPCYNDLISAVAFLFFIFPTKETQEPHTIQPLSSNYCGPAPFPFILLPFILTVTGERGKTQTPNVFLPKQLNKRGTKEQGRGRTERLGEGEVGDILGLGGFK